jgi:hypothetical protein
MIGKEYGPHLGQASLKYPLCKYKAMEGDAWPSLQLGPTYLLPYDKPITVIQNTRSRGPRKNLEPSNETSVYGAAS